MSEPARQRILPFNLTEYLNNRKAVINVGLEKSLASLRPGCEPRLYEAIEYALMGNGKRLRGIMTLAACEASGGNTDDALPPAVAVECVHSYSLVHDDLPSMDDDDERRGKPTVHVAYDEATAILVGDALLTEGLGIVARWSLNGVGNPEYALQAQAAAAELAAAAGAGGMVSGQAYDMNFPENADVKHLDRVHTLKTGALFSAAAAMGAIAAGTDVETVNIFRDYGMKVGLAFQVADDILDEDEKGPSYYRMHGKDKAMKMALGMAQEARVMLSEFGEKARPLNEIAEFAVRRLH